MTFCREKAKLIAELEKRGILHELMPIHDGNGGSIWHYEVLKPEFLPEKLRQEFEKEGKIWN